MARGGLQEVDATTLRRLHDAALTLGADAREATEGDWRAGLDASARAAATIAATRVSTQLMEIMSWLLTAQAVAAGELPDPGRAAWRAGIGERAPAAPLAAAVERLYARVVELDAGIR